MIAGMGDLIIVSGGQTEADRAAEFAERHRITVLNVAGTRASNEPEVGAFVAVTLTAALNSP